MREYFEEHELKTLAPYAVHSKHSKGKQHPETACPSRTCFQRDRDRIIHSKSFRRLKDKTQVFISTESDHFRSRLTHTLEVAQISRHIARVLHINEDLAEAIALAHDLGHTPFGHAGERVLHQLLLNWGGFEHNQQSLRIVDTIERKYPEFPGLNLSYEVRQGLIKHASPWDNPSPSDHFSTLEAQVVNIADEIAYNNHDLDDGLSANILDENELTKALALWSETKIRIQDQYPQTSIQDLKYRINSLLISTQINDVVSTTLENIQRYDIQSLSDVQKTKDPIVTFSASMKKNNDQLRTYLFENFYSYYKVYRMNKKGQLIIDALFKGLNEDHKLLPIEYQTRLHHPDPPQRVISDYIAGMTDHFAIKEYQQLFEVT